MSEKKSHCVIVFAGGGTGGHIYPGIAVADEIRKSLADSGVELEIHWIGSASGMDRNIVEKNFSSCGGSITAFHGISCGKLRRYFSFKNFIDLFKITAGFVRSYFILKKLKPDCLFSKGGFVSVPPCVAARLLKIPYFTHECDFTPGLATKLNSGGARNILLSYEETRKFFAGPLKEKCIATGNPVRPVFYEDSSAAGRKFLGIPEDNNKPVLLVIGGSLGALQINRLVVDCLDRLKEKYIVVHQTGKKFADENPQVMASADDDYKPFAFIYGEMVSVIQCADVVLSRAGANSLSECAVCAKPMVLVPLCGSGTRGDQVDNAEYFRSRGGAVVLAGEDANDEKLLAELDRLSAAENRKALSDSLRDITGQNRPVKTIADLVIKECGL